MQSDLIFDLGMHRGEDTEFYLKKGFRVVAVEADPDLAARNSEKFADAIAAGRLVIVNKAIAPKAGRITMHRNLSRAVWNTLDPAWAERNAAWGHGSEAVEIEATTLCAVIAEHGVPLYLKIDIEGMDMVALAALESFPDRPKFVSIESEQGSFRALREEFALLERLGYNRFKVIDQNRVAQQSEPNPALIGAYSGHQFSYGSSGLFGDEAPGRWLSMSAAIERYRSIFLRYALTGDDPLIRSKFLVKLLRKLGFGPSWYDTHATRA